MYLEPPQGSKIKIIQDGGERIIKIPHHSGGILKYFVALFILFWLGGWVFGFVSAWGQVMSGKGDAFLIFWLGGWTIGGAFAGYFFYRIVRPSVDESLSLGVNSINYDPGVAPFKFDLNIQNAKEFWFPKRTRLKLSTQILQTLTLRKTNSGNRLTVDHNSHRIDIGKSASEIEREWLYKVLSQTYT